MPRLRAVLAAALTLGALAVPRAHAERVEWVVTGSRTAYVEFAVESQVSLAAPRVSTKGRHAGIYVEQVSYRDGMGPSRWGGGWVALRGLGPDPRRLEPLQIGLTPYFEPGVVRVYLVADGPTTVRIAADGQDRFRELRPTRRVKSHARVAPLASTAAGLAATLPVRLGRDDFAAAFVRVTGERAVLADTTLCVRAPGAACETSPGARFGSAPPGGDPLDAERQWKWNGRLSGDAVADATVKPFEPLRRAVLGAFTLELVDTR